MRDGYLHEAIPDDLYHDLTVMASEMGVDVEVLAAEVLGRLAGACQRSRLTRIAVVSGNAAPTTIVSRMLRLETEGVQVFAVVVERIRRGSWGVDLVAPPLDAPVRHGFTLEASEEMVEALLMDAARRLRQDVIERRDAADNRDALVGGFPKYTIGPR